MYREGKATLVTDEQVEAQHCTCLNYIVTLLTLNVRSSRKYIPKEVYLAATSADCPQAQTQHEEMHQFTATVHQAYTYARV